MAQCQQTIANFYSDLADLVKVDFGLIRTKDFKRDANDPGKVERYQAEALIKDHVPVAALIGIGCFFEAQARDLSWQLELRDISIPVLARPNWYF